LKYTDGRRGLALLVEKISVNLREKKIRKLVHADVRRWKYADGRREKISVNLREKIQKKDFTQMFAD
jgi:hypothetical protein